MFRFPRAVASKGRSVSMALLYTFHSSSIHCSRADRRVGSDVGGWLGDKGKAQSLRMDDLSLFDPEICGSGVINLHLEEDAGQIQPPPTFQ